MRGLLQNPGLIHEDSREAHWIRLVRDWGSVIAVERFIRGELSWRRLWHVVTEWPHDSERQLLALTPIRSAKKRHTQRKKN